MITIRIRYFAVLRERRGVSQETMQTQATTVGELINHLIATFRLGLPAHLIRVAIAQSFVESDHHLEDGMELVLIPPVAGG